MFTCFFFSLYFSKHLHSQEVPRMLRITNLEDGLDVFKALGSEVRIRILNILLENNGINMKDLAQELDISNGALTAAFRIRTSTTRPSRSDITATATSILPAVLLPRSI